jgi:hypothetical protein
MIVKTKAKAKKAVAEPNKQLKPVAELSRASNVS